MWRRRKQREKNHEGSDTVEPISDSIEPIPDEQMHAHEVTADDAALIRMMAGARFGAKSSITLPSGKTITGTEMQRWVEANPLAR